MKIYQARYGGVCFGVQRAIRIALNAAQDSDPVFSLGPLIHNRVAVEQLRKNGIITVNTIRAIKGKKVIIRSHGVHPKVLETLRRRHCDIIDATCPRVRRAQRYVEKLVQEGYFVIIIGEQEHPEVKGLLGYGGEHAQVYSETMVLKRRKIGVVPQTTLDLERFNSAIAHMLSSVVEMKIYNTICKATILRIGEAIRIAHKADVMIVVGGKNSANTTRLYEICKKIKPSYHIETVSEISEKWFKGAKSVGVTAGASTPKEQVDEVIQYIKDREP
ncbi:4-hydroxy-3-methylbut-2-enyl diphosphate reductase [candidate division WOR-3 bacterium]|nr:4-hydroxy-3-methylbut-2-enyl diphosphate reductase [candidate division WOR-3 bacterium]